MAFLFFEHLHRYVFRLLHISFKTMKRSLHINSDVASGSLKMLLLTPFFLKLALTELKLDLK